MPRTPDEVPDAVLALLIDDGLSPPDPAEERQRMRRAGLQMLVRGDADYPALLAVLDDAPLGLWVRGDPYALGPVPVGVVGARRASAYGIAQAGRFAGRLAEEGMTIVSGGARGVDAEAHRAALRANSPTVAVVGCGLGAGPYPPEHGALYQSIVDAGGLIISELPTLWPVLPANFPRRNRIISGICAGVLVVEAAVASGALITARLALDHNREVFAIPGPVDSVRSEGCNRAIRDGLAACALDPEELFESLRASGSNLLAGTRAAQMQRPPSVRTGGRVGARTGHAAGSRTEHLAFASLPDEVQRAVPVIRKLLRKEPDADSARIVEVTGLPAHHAQMALTILELS